MTDTDYRLLRRQVEAMLEDESDALANACNFVAALCEALADVNWLGIYVRRGDELVLGPFQGKPACVRIPLGKGVCGTAAATGETQRVDDVRAFPGHIVCDEASRSELVVPLVIRGELAGVLDIDSPREARFDAEDQRGLEAVCATYCEIAARGSTFI